MQEEFDKRSAESSAAITDCDMGGGLIVPSSLHRIEGALKDKIDEADEEKTSLILKECFGETVERIKDYCDLPIVELEENLFVIELESVRAFEGVEKEKRAMLIASTFAAAYSDLAIEGRARLFLPFEKGLLFGAVLAKRIGVPFEIFVASEEEEFAVCQASVKALNDKDVKCASASKDAAFETINNFSEYDDYIFDPVSAMAASAFEAVEEDEDEVPSIIVSVASPMRFALEVTRALGVKAKDEKEARRKLEELFAVEPIE